MKAMIQSRQDAYTECRISMVILICLMVFGGMSHADAQRKTPGQDENAAGSYINKSIWIQVSDSERFDSIERKLQGKSGSEKIMLMIGMVKQYSMRHPGLSMQLATEADRLALESGNPALRASTLNALSILYFYAGNNEKAIELMLEAISHQKEACAREPDSLRMLKRLESMYSNAGNIYHNFGKLEMALQMHQHAMRIVDELLSQVPGDNDFANAYLVTINNTAVLFWQLGEHARADALLSDALATARKKRLPSAVMITLNNIGLIRIEQKKFTEAIGIYNEALELGSQLGDSMGIGGNYNNLGLIMEKMGRIPESVGYYRKSLAISERLSYSHGITNTCANLGRLYNMLGNPDSALYFAGKGVSISQMSDNPNMLQKNYHTLFEVYHKLGNNEKALEYHILSTQLKDSVFNVEKSRQIAEMEARFQNEKKEKENQILRQRIEIQQRTKLLMLVSILAFVILSLYLISFYRMKNRNLKQKTILLEKEASLQEITRERLEDQLFAEKEINRLQAEKLEFKNRELSSRILHAISLNEMIDSVKQTMESSMVLEKEACEHSLQKINQLLKESQGLEAEWDQFKMHFDEVNPAFFHQLQTAFPDLSQHDLKLCAYYRINLGTKEIARMLHVSPAAIQKSRHRLRKKMNIPSDEELPQFMSRF